MTGARPLLQTQGLHKRFDAVTALQPTDLRIERGQFVSLLGPSGSGKSTLLRLLCGVTPASGGTIELDGRRIEALPPERRGVAMVFQSGALFPHLNVDANIGFGLRMARVAAAERRRRVDEAVAVCRLDGLQQRMPRELSGGQQQRVALARALAMRPALTLFDEPLSSLDAPLREALREDILRLHRATGATSLYVTHDPAEAMALSDRVLVMDAGRLVEDGSPVTLYRRPRRAFTAGLLGPTNLVEVEVADGLAQLPWGEQKPLDGAPAGARRACVSIRPEDLALMPDMGGCGRVVRTRFRGGAVHDTVQIAASLFEVSRGGESPLWPEGTRVTVALRTAALWALDDAAP